MYCAFGANSVFLSDWQFRLIIAWFGVSRLGQSCELERHDSINILFNIGRIGRDGFYEKQRANCAVWKFSTENNIRRARGRESDAKVAFAIRSFLGTFLSSVSVWTTVDILWRAANNCRNSHRMWEPIETN